MANETSLQDIEPGTVAEVAMVVGTRDLASAYAADAGEAYPQVLATPALVGLLERACASQIQRLLSSGEMSVGVHVNVTHKAPTPLGATVKARSQFLRREGRLFVFDVQASDAGGVVATGEHARAIVRAQAVVDGAARRVAVFEGMQ